MADIRTWNKAIVAELISLYQSYPCLWKVKSEEYKNKFLKEAAYVKLIDFCKAKGFDEANRDFVVKKIQSLRGSFRKELKKLIDSQRSGTEVYKSSLWYFDNLLFTKDQELNTNSRSNIEEDVEEEGLSHDADDDETNGLDEEEKHNQSDEASTETNTGPLYHQNKRKCTQICQRDVSTDTQRVSRAEELSDLDIAGMNVARKLAKMDPLQAIYAESVINNVLRAGLLNKLTEDTDMCENRCVWKTFARTSENQIQNIFRLASVPTTLVYQEEESQDIKPVTS